MYKDKGANTIKMGHLGSQVSILCLACLGFSALSLAL